MRFMRLFLYDFPRSKVRTVAKNNSMIITFLLALLYSILLKRGWWKGISKEEEGREENKWLYECERISTTAARRYNFIKSSKTQVRIYSSKTRFLNWRKSLDRAAVSSINEATPPITGASRCDRFAVRKTFNYQPKVPVSSGLPLVLCENSKLTKPKWDTELEHACFPPAPTFIL